MGASPQQHKRAWLRARADHRLSVRSLQEYHPGLLADLYHPDAAYVAWCTGHRGLATFDLPGEVVPYVNRLSDHLFVLGRRVNDGGALDVLWTPGANR